MHSKFFDYFEKLQKNFQSIEEEIKLLSISTGRRGKASQEENALLFDVLGELQTWGCHKWGPVPGSQGPRMAGSVSPLPNKDILCGYKDNLKRSFRSLSEGYHEKGAHYYASKYGEDFSNCFERIEANILAAELLLAHQQVFTMEALKAHFKPFLPNVDYEISVHGEKGLVFTVSDEPSTSEVMMICNKFKLALEALGVELTDVPLQEGQKLVVAVDDATPILELEDFSDALETEKEKYIEEKTDDSSLNVDPGFDARPQENYETQSRVFSAPSKEEPPLMPVPQSSVSEKREQQSDSSSSQVAPLISRDNLENSFKSEADNAVSKLEADIKRLESESWFAFWMVSTKPRIHVLKTIIDRIKQDDGKTPLKALIESVEKEGSGYAKSRWVGSPGKAEEVTIRQIIESQRCVFSNNDKLTTTAQCLEDIKNGPSSGPRSGPK